MGSAMIDFNGVGVRFCDIKVAAGDVVYTGDVQVGCVQACLLVDGLLYVVVKTFRKDGDDHAIYWGLWRPTAAYAAWVATSVQVCVAWKPAEGDAMLVLR